MTHAKPTHVMQIMVANRSKLVKQFFKHISIKIINYIIYFIKNNGFDYNRFSHYGFYSVEMNVN